MNLVKIINGLPLETEGMSRQWALGEDGELYCRLVGVEWATEWTKYDNGVSGCSLREMKMIVKEFGHLVIYT